MGSVFRVRIDDASLQALMRSLVAIIDFSPKQRLSNRRRSTRRTSMKKSRRTSIKKKPIKENTTKGDVNAGKIANNEMKVNNNERLAMTDSQSDDEHSTGASSNVSIDEDDLTNEEVSRYALALLNSMDLADKLASADPIRVAESKRKLVIHHYVALMEPTSTISLGLNVTDTSSELIVQVTHALT